MNADKTGNYRLGKLGEQVAAEYLTDKGYAILAHNFRRNTGEIDLIAQREDYIVFIEVKLRRGMTFGRPSEAVTHSKQMRIARTAQWYLAERQLYEHYCRFDVVEVMLDGSTVINHIENAFDMSF